MTDINKFLSNNREPESFGEASLNLLIAAVDASSRLNNQSAILIDFDKHQPLFMSDNLIYLDEATPKDVKRVSPNPYWALVTDETLESLLEIDEKYPKLRSALHKEEYDRHLCIVDYPISIKGKEFYINSRYTPVITHSDGTTRVGLFNFAPSSKNEFSFLLITTSGKRWTYDFKEKKFLEFDLGSRLTITEKAILQRAKKGMSNEEIANDLYLSLNTVKTHRFHIFKKLGVDSITEALAVIGNYQLL